jgi:carboxyl-terminal processing protease
MRYLLLLIHLLFSCSLLSNEIPKKTGPELNVVEINNLATLGKLWGFLKYYHPAVANGAVDWDSVLLVKTPVFLKAGNAKDIDNIVSAWLNELSPVGNCEKCDNNLSGKFLANLDTQWISNVGFSPGIMNRLRFIRNNRFQGEPYYFAVGPASQIRIVNEKTYSSRHYLYPAPADRLLTLFRYWNIVNYFSPYKYIASKKWDSVLIRFIPSFYAAKDTLDYHFTIMKLVGALEDGHTSLTWSVSMLRHMKDYHYVPFQCFIVENKAVVTKIYDAALCGRQGIELYDIIDSIDGESVADRIQKFSPYVHAASNVEAAMANICETFLFSGADSICPIVKTTDKGRERQWIVRYKTQAFAGEAKPVSWKLLPGNIGYVDMEHLRTAEVEAMMDSLDNTKGIIFDLRDYPRGTWPAIGARLSPTKFYMCRQICPDPGYPGVFKYLPKRWVGKENPAHYKGKVVLLVNAYSKSHSEYSAMALQAAAKTITIGSTTAGADGNLTDWITLPGGFRTRFSGLGVYYPDGTVAQKKGVKINIFCKPSLKGALSRKDELMEMAIHVIQGQL